MRDVAGFLKIILNIPFKKVVLPGRVKCSGTEGEIEVVYGCRKRKELICGSEGKIVVAHCRLPSPAWRRMVESEEGGRKVGCRKKLICGPDREIVVAHGRLPSPALTGQIVCFETASITI